MAIIPEECARCWLQGWNGAVGASSVTDVRAHRIDGRVVVVVVKWGCMGSQL